MNFGEILDKWDEQNREAKKSHEKSVKKQGSGKKANAPHVEKEFCRNLNGNKNEKQSKNLTNPNEKMEQWLLKHGTIDKDAMNKADSERQKFKSATYIEKLKVEKEIDLHGLTQDEAIKRLEIFVTDAFNEGLKKIMIVHGKGIHTKGATPVLGDTVRRFIENDKRLGRSGHPDERHGGRGSTWGILKNNL